MKKLSVGLAVATSMFCLSHVASAGLMTAFNDGPGGWIQFNSQSSTEDGSVAPGVGGQSFDAEYLSYKIEGNNLWLGLQTGFNLETGKVYYSGKDYYAGDLALSFDGNSGYEYAVDFGLYTEDYLKNDGILPNNGTSGDKVEADIDNNGKDAAGLYSAITWNNDVYSGHTTANPFAMDGGTIVGGALLTNTWNSETVGGNLSYYRTVSLDLTKILGADWAIDGFTLGAHWTMSCGNDAIDGSVTIPGAPVPEPTTMLLFGAGLAGLAGVTRRRRSH